MKKLLIIRHSKSGWDSSIESDHKRTINADGKAESSIMEIVLRIELNQVEEVYCSSATRAKMTAETLKIDPQKLSVKDELYTFKHKELGRFIFDLNSTANYVQIIGHNPGITDFINLNSNGRIHNVPTTGAMILEWPDAKTWADTEKNKGELVFFDCPKNNK